MREPALAASVSQSLPYFSYQHFFVPHVAIHPDMTKAIVTQEKLDLRHPVFANTVSFLHIIQHVACFSGVPIQQLLQKSKPILNTPGGTVNKQRKKFQISEDHVVWGIRWDIQEEFTSLYVNFFHSPPKGGRGRLMSPPLSGISELSFDSTLLSPLLLFCLVLLPFLSYRFLPAGPFF